MILVNFKEIELSFGGYPLFNGINYQINSGEKIALIGRNGSGKTTLLKLLNRELEPDSGEIFFSQGIKIAYLSQIVPNGSGESLFEFVLGGAGNIGRLISNYNDINFKLSKKQSKFLLNELDKISHLIDINKGWEIERTVKEILDKFELDGNSKFETLSAGKKRVALLTRTLISKPELLLLDEPTNHLDISMIVWLEEFIKNYKGTVLFVTHDRTLIEKTATCIVELDRGQLSVWNCSYIEYLERKKDSLIIEQKERKQFLRKLSDEEIWIRQGIKARRTRNEGRVKKLIQMREEKIQMRNVAQKSDFSIQDARSSGKIVLKAKHISFKYDDIDVINDFSTTISRGDKIGILGKNGCGKTTLLNILLGTIKSNSGVIELGTNLSIQYFDQLKEYLDESKTIVENVGDGNDLLEINGKTKHIIGYLQEFLFSPEKARSKVSVLSGGEKARVVLAKLFTLPSNLLIMDEPTNDLDIETLELLEELLINYSGTLLIVSHDRTFLNNIATSVLVFKGEGKIEEFIGGYSEINKESTVKKKAIINKKKVVKGKTQSVQVKKLSYKEQNALESLPEIIEKLEKEQGNILEEMSKPDYYRQSGDYINDKKKQLGNLGIVLEKKYLEWEDLEAKVQAYKENKIINPPDFL